MEHLPACTVALVLPLDQIIKHYHEETAEDPMDGYENILHQESHKCIALCITSKETVCVIKQASKQ